MLQIQKQIVEIMHQLSESNFQGFGADSFAKEINGSSDIGELIINKSAELKRLADRLDRSRYKGEISAEEDRLYQGEIRALDKVCKELGIGAEFSDRVISTIDFKNAIDRYIREKVKVKAEGRKRKRELVSGIGDNRGNKERVGVKKEEGLEHGRGIEITGSYNSNIDYKLLSTGGNLTLGSSSSRVAELNKFLGVSGNTFTRETLQKLTIFLRSVGYRGNVKLAGKTTFGKIGEYLRQNPANRGSKGAKKSGESSEAIRVSETKIKGKLGTTSELGISQKEYDKLIKGLVKDLNKGSISLSYGVSSVRIGGWSGLTSLTQVKRNDELKQALFKKYGINENSGTSNGNHPRGEKSGGESGGKSNGIPQENREQKEGTGIYNSNIDYKLLSTGGNLTLGSSSSRVAELNKFLGVSGNTFTRETLQKLTTFLRSVGYRGNVKLAGKITFGKIREYLKQNPANRGNKGAEKSGESTESLNALESTLNKMFGGSRGPNNLGLTPDDYSRFLKLLAEKLNDGKTLSFNYSYDSGGEIYTKYASINKNDLDDLDDFKDTLSVSSLGKLIRFTATPKEASFTGPTSLEQATAGNPDSDSSAGINLGGSRNQNDEAGIGTRGVEIDDRQTEFKDEGRKAVDESNFPVFLRRLSDDLVTNGKIELEYNTSSSSGYDPLNPDATPKSETKRITITKESLEESLKIPGVGEALLKKYGYSDDRGFFDKLLSGSFGDGGEINALIRRLENTKKLNLNDLQSVKGFLFDFDFDSVIETELRDVLTEAMIDYYVKSIEEIQNILENLGLGRDLKVLKEPGFRDKFYDRLITALKIRRTPFTVLTIKDGLKSSISMSLDRDLKKEKEIADSIKDKDIKDKLRAEGIPETRQNIEIVKRATIAISMGYYKALGLNVNIKDLTRGIIDGINIGIDSSGNIGIGINKELISVSLGRTGISVPAGISLSGFGLGFSPNITTGSEADNHSLTLGGSIGVAFVSGTPVAFGINISENASSNVQGINKILARESRILDAIIEKVVSGKKFSDSELKGLYTYGDITSNDIANLRSNIRELRQMYQEFVLKQDPRNRKKITEELKRSILTSLMNKLFVRQGTGLKFTGIGGFLVPGVIAGAYPVFEANFVTYSNDPNVERNADFNNLHPLSSRELIDRHGGENIKFEGESIIALREAVDYTAIKGKVKVEELGNGRIKITPINGLDISSLNINQRIIADPRTNTTRVLFSISSVGNGAVEGGGSSSVIDIPKEFLPLEKELSKVESAFSFRTRYNKGASLLMTPGNSLDQRWQGLLILSKGVKALRNSNLGKIINMARGDRQKMQYVISRVLQYMRKAYNYDNGNVDSWNSRTDEYIARDRKRRGSFDRLFGFSLGSEAEQYYGKLRQAKGSIGTYTMTGLSFDAVASTNVEGKSKVRGIDTFRGEIDMLSVNGQPLMIEISDSGKVKKLLERAKKAGISNTNGLKFFYYKDPQGFDDRIVVLRGSGGGGQGTTNVDYIDQNNHSVGLVPVWTWDMREPEPEPDKNEEDKEEGDKEEGDKEEGDKEEGDKEEGDKESGDKESGDKESGDKESGDEKSPDEESSDPGERGGQTSNPGERGGQTSNPGDTGGNTTNNGGGDGPPDSQSGGRDSTTTETGAGADTTNGGGDGPPDSQSGGR